MRVGIKDINNRIQLLNSNITSELNVNLLESVYRNDSFSVKNAEYAIYNWRNLNEDGDVNAFLEALNIYSDMCNSKTSNGLLNTLGTYIISEANKVRNADQLKRSLKMRLGRLNNKITTKTTNKFDSVTNAVQRSISNLTNTLPSSVIKTPMTTTSSGGSDEVSMESYVLLSAYGVASKNNSCDRIIENYKKINKRYGVNQIIAEMTDSTEIYEVSMRMANFMDTYNLPFKDKYSIALECLYYGMESHRIHPKPSTVIDAVTDYFIFTRGLSESELYDIMDVSTKSIVFDSPEFDTLGYLNLQDAEDSPESSYIDIPQLVSQYTGDGISESIASKIELKKAEGEVIGGTLAASAKKGIVDGKNAVKDDKLKNQIDEFRKNCNKDPNDKTLPTKFKSLISSIFSKTPEQIIFEMPNLLGVIRAFIIIGALAIHPIVGLLSFITSEILKVHYSRKSLDKIISAYKNEIKLVEGKLEKKDNEDLQKYLDELKKDLDKIETYEREMYTDEENDERDEAKWAAESESNDNDSSPDSDEEDDWDDMDWSDIDEQTSISINNIATIMESLIEPLKNRDVSGLIKDNIVKLSPDVIDTIADFSITVPVILERKPLCSTIEEYRNDLRKSSRQTKSIDDYIKINRLNEAIYKLNNAPMTYNTSVSLYDCEKVLTLLDEMVKFDQSIYITEMDFINNIKIAMNNIKRDAVKLSDAEKRTSKNIDMSLGSIAKGINDCMKADARDRVAAEKILPPASKCIKYAIATGAAWAVNPALAVLGVVGKIFCDKKFEHKFKQQALDDIEVELKIVKRKIDEAENNNAKSDELRELYKIERELERQKQRIKYSFLTKGKAVTLPND